MLIDSELFWFEVKTAKIFQDLFTNYFLKPTNSENFQNYITFYLIIAALLISMMYILKLHTLITNFNTGILITSWVF